MNRLMAEIHRLIVQQGIEEARRQAATKHQRSLVEAAYQVMTEEAAKLGFGAAWMPLRRSPGARRSRAAETGLKTAAIGHLSELVTRLSSRHAPHRRSAMEITR